VIRGCAFRQEYDMSQDPEEKLVIERRSADMKAGRVTAGSG